MGSSGSTMAGGSSSAQDDPQSTAKKPRPPSISICAGNGPSPIANLTLNLNTEPSMLVYNEDKSYSNIFSSGDENSHPN